MILVAGATGLLGGRISRRLLQDRQDVRVLVRPHSAYQTLAEAGAQPVFGDLREPDSLAATMVGVETVITTATAGERDGDDTVERVDLAGNQSLIEAAANAGVRQFIFVSTMGSDPDSPVPMFRAKGLAEARLRQSKLTYTILQPNGFLDVWLPLVVGLPLRRQRPVVIIGEGRRKHTFVAQEDVAALATAAIGHPAAANATIAIGGPAALSWRDIIATVETVLGQRIALETQPPGTQLPDLPPIVSTMMAALDTYDSPIDMTDTARTFGVTLTPLDAWVRANLVPILA